MADQPSRPEVVARVRTDIEATAIKSALQAEGIDARSTGGYLCGFRAEAPGEVVVMVDQRHLARARQVLAELPRDVADIDWSTVDVGRPE